MFPSSVPWQGGFLESLQVMGLGWTSEVSLHLLLVVDLGLKSGLSDSLGLVLSWLPHSVVSLVFQPSTSLLEEAMGLLLISSA